MPQATPYNPSKPQIRLRPENKLATTNFPNEIARVVNQNQALPKCGPVIESVSGVGKAAELPSGQYQGMVYGMTTNNAAGFDFVRAVPLFL